MTVAKGAVVTEINKPVEIQEIEWTDDLTDYEVGVRLLSCGLCHSDYHVVNGELQIGLPAIIGHEGTGIVERVGKRVTFLKPGDHVVTCFVPPCGKCPSCIAGQGHLCDWINPGGGRKDGTYRNINRKGQHVGQLGDLGALSEYIICTEAACIKVDNDLDLNKIPIVGCRVPTGWGSVINLAQAKPGSTALVIGLGGVGFNVLQGLKTAGAVVIIAADIHDKKKWAMEWGATHYIDASRQDIVEETMKITGIGVDTAYECVGDPALQDITVRAIRKTGKAVWVGIVPNNMEHKHAFDTWIFSHYQKTIIGSLYGGASPFQTVPQLLNMYRAAKIKLPELITKEYKLSQINEAYADMLAGKLIAGVIRLQ
ncbi:MAG TPA: alcohol dehydrogenase catalytic domain-containing protein [Dehalococcoidales bacterium]|nr:alcohol dehydrogenase catalytic domain-containing protein [Dehalococcoidales bacterium]